MVTLPLLMMVAGQPNCLMQILQSLHLSVTVHFLVLFTIEMHGDLKIIALTPLIAAHSFTAATDAFRFKGSVLTTFLTPIPLSTASIST